MEPPRVASFSASRDEHKIPVRYVGLGERAEDLREFIADEFVEALFGGERRTRPRAASIAVRRRLSPRFRC